MVLDQQVFSYQWLTRVSKEMEPIAFLDSNTSLHDTFVGGIKVLDPSKLEKLVKEVK